MGEERGKTVSGRGEGKDELSRRGERKVCGRGEGKDNLRGEERIDKEERGKTLSGRGEGKDSKWERRGERRIK